MKHSIMSFALLLAFGACSESDSSTSREPVKPSSSSSTQRAAGVEGDIRKCDLEIGGVTTGRLGGFFQAPVSNLEGAVTFCLTLSGSGTNIDGTLRIEFEDDMGVLSYNTSAENVFGGEIKINDDGSTNVNMIFIDDAGFVQVKGSTTSSSSTFSGAINYYNFPSYEDALNAQVQEAQQKCKDGTYTVAQCLGYNFPYTFWWNETNIYTSEHQRMMDQAMAILNDGTKTKQLGTVNFDISQVYDR